MTTINYYKFNKLAVFGVIVLIYLKLRLCKYDLYGCGYFGCNN